MDNISQMIESSDLYLVTPDNRFYFLFPFIVVIITGFLFLPNVQKQIYMYVNSYQYTYFISLFIILIFSIIFNSYFFDDIVKNFCIKQN